MRVASLITFVVLASAAPSQAPGLIPASYLSPKQETLNWERLAAVIGRLLAPSQAGTK